METFADWLYTICKEQVFYNFHPFLFFAFIVSLPRMEIIPQVTEAFVSGVAIGALVFAALVFVVMLAPIIIQSVDIPS